MENEQKTQNSPIIFDEIITPTPDNDFIFYADENVDDLNNIRKKFFSRQVTIVAKMDNKVIGNVDLHRVIIHCNGKIEKQLALSLYSIDPVYIKHNIGADLISKACEKAKYMGCQALFVRGNPAYFSTYGFVPTHNYNLFCVNDETKESNIYMVKELVDGYLKNVEGEIEFE